MAQLRTLGRIWSSGRAEVTSLGISPAMISENDYSHSWKKLTPCRGAPKGLQEGSWHESLVLTMCWGERNPTDISWWTYSSSILPVLLQVVSTKWLLPHRDENCLLIFSLVSICSPAYLLLPPPSLWFLLLKMSFSRYQDLTVLMSPKDPQQRTSFTDHPLHKCSFRGVDMQDSPSFSYWVAKKCLFSSLEIGQ